MNGVTSNENKVYRVRLWVMLDVTGFNEYNIKLDCVIGNDTRYTKIKKEKKKGGGVICLTESVKSGQEIHINHSGVGRFEPPWPNSWFCICGK